ncbi:MAG: 2-polyprenylphenol 6-hydroxylase [Halieaceae bacterium]|nr:2-polyprenylphenol 6-hydroxylase [Halieaceae bacterium]
MMRTLKVLLIARRHRLGALIADSSATTSLLKHLLGARAKASDGPRGERLRLALESLGPVPIKLGQLLSTRRDILPDDIADELARLQDKVAPFPGESAIKIIEEELQSDIAAAFQTFDSTPLAAASVAQVHAITLNDGEEAVVKVLRPGIEKQIAADIRLLKRIAGLIDRLSDDLKRLRLPEVVEDYEVTITTELDLRREAANASLLKKNTAAHRLVFVPTIFWDYSTPRLMVSERISGIPIGDIAALNEANVNMKVLAERGVEIFFSQVFDDCFFHADMHPGNIFVDATSPETPTYIAVDCAIVGQLSRGDQYYVARNLLAILQRNYRLVAELHTESGWVPSSTRVQDFEATIRMLCEPIFDRPLHQISLGHMLVNLFRAASAFDMKVQPQLVLLQKTLLNIEGLGRQLYPELNLWETAKPFLADWLKRQYSPVNVIKQLKRDAPAFVHHASQLPEVIPQFLATQREALKTAPSESKPSEGSPLLVGSGIATLIVTLLAELSNPWYVAIGTLLVIVGLIRRRK